MHLGAAPICRNSGVGIHGAGGRRNGELLASTEEANAGRHPKVSAWRLSNARRLWKTETKHPGFLRGGARRLRKNGSWIALGFEGKGLEGDLGRGDGVEDDVAPSHENASLIRLPVEVGHDSTDHVAKEAIPTPPKHIANDNEDTRITTRMNDQSHIDGGSANGEGGGDKENGGSIGSDLRFQESTTVRDSESNRIDDREPTTPDSRMDSLESQLIKQINSLPPGGTLKHVLSSWEGKLSIQSQLFVLKRIQKWELTLAFLGWMKPKLQKMATDSQVPVKLKPKPQRHSQKNSISKPKEADMTELVSASQDSVSVSKPSTPIERDQSIANSNSNFLPNVEPDQELGHNNSGGTQNIELDVIKSAENQMESYQMQDKQGRISFYEYALLCAHNIVLNKLGREKKWGLMDKMFADLLHMGLSPDVYTYKAFINAYGHDNKLDKAEEWFWKMSSSVTPPNSQLCFLLLNHYRRCNLYSKLTDLYEDIQSKLSLSSTPRELYLLLLEAYASQNKLHDVRSIIEEMKTKRIIIGPDVCAQIVIGFVKAKNAREAKNILDFFIYKGININTETWHNVMYAFASEGNYQETLSLFNRMDEQGLNIDVTSYDMLLHACTHEKRVEEGERIVKILREKEIPFSSKTYAYLIDLYVNSKKYKKAISVFQKNLTEEKTTELAFCSMMTMYGKLGLVHEARRIFAKLRKHHPTISSKSYGIMINIFGKSSLFIPAEELYKQSQTKKGMQYDVVLHNIMIKIYSKWRRRDDAMRIFQKIKSLSLKPCIVTYSTLIDMHGKEGRIDDAIKLYDEMRSANITPNDFVFTSLLSAYKESRQFASGIQFWEHLIQEGYKPTATVVPLLIELFGLVGRGPAAIDLFESTVKSEPNFSVKVFNAMLSTYALMQDHEAVVGLHRRMEKLGVEMDMDSYACVIHSLRRLGRYGDASDMTVTMHQYLESIPSSEFII